MTLHKQRGQGMTEYIIIVALVAVAAIAVYEAFGDVVRGQTAVAAATLAGNAQATGRGLVGSAGGAANTAAHAKHLNDFEN